MVSVYLYPMRTSTFIFPFSIFSFVNKSTIYTYIQHSPKGNIPLAQIYAVDMRAPSTFAFRTACSKLAGTVSDNESYL